LLLGAHGELCSEQEENLGSFHKSIRHALFPIIAGTPSVATLTSLFSETSALVEIVSRAF